MKRKNFFRNIGSILTFALIGTVISTIIIGVLVYMAVHFLSFTHIHPELELSMLDCIVFGSILSSTDPVTILAIFHQLRVDPKLYAIIFGESILNDSVAIVLFKVLGEYRNKDVTIGNIFGGISSFIAIFTGSVMVGVIIALICALMLKHSRLHEFASLESSIIVLLAYSSYLLSNGVQLSGIVSLLFCGICLKHYGYNNMSIRTRRTTKYMFRVLSQLCENFVFIYLGVTVFTSLKNEVYQPGLIFLTLVICMFARYMSVIPLARLINFVSAKLHRTSGREEIPRNHQLMLWWAGLRGAIAFALSFEVKGDTAKIIQTTTLIICIITVILLGGTTNMALQRLEIRTGVGKKMAGSLPGAFDEEEDEDGDGSSDEDTDSSDGEAEDWDDDLPGATSRDDLAQFHDTSSNDVHHGGRHANGGGGVRIDMVDDSSSSSLALSPRGAASLWDDDMTHWFISFDNKWLKPLFTRTRWKWGRSSRGASVRGSSGARLITTSGRSDSPTREQLLDERRRKSGSGGGGGRGSLVRGKSSRAFGNAAELGATPADAKGKKKGGATGNLFADETFQDVNGNVWTANAGGSSRRTPGSASSGGTSPLPPQHQPYRNPASGALELDVQSGGGQGYSQTNSPQQQRGAGGVARGSRSQSKLNVFDME
ncbi:monovalent cation:H+ antiporter, CPA1 (nhx1) [Thoreauomyces humboldtii]|nr:monovalent cation:H+ antiporter, CPA1 (nhx1) [Thoreauomyces humboldtii]